MSRFIGILLGTVFPPIGVWMLKGFAGAFWLNLLLTLFFYVPGVVHGMWVVAHTHSDGRDAPDGWDTFVALLLGFVFPPLGAFWKAGLSPALLVNLLLTLCFWFPGSLHALWLITRER